MIRKGGNQLSKVTDAAANAGGFTDGANNATEYSYNATGSLTADQNKGISTITYNVLGKPQQITYGNGTTIVYTYDASGTKLKTATTVSGTTTTTDYAGSYVYTNNALSFFSSPEGRVVKNGSNYEYQYAITDHQGNTRVVFTSTTPTAASTLADFDADANDQSSQFSNVPTPVTYSAANHTPSGSKVVRLNQTVPIGPGLSKKVFAGDKVDLEVWSYYEAASGYGTSNIGTASLISSIATALIANTGGVDAGGLKSSGVNSALSNFGVGANQGDTQPAAFLNYILFDQNYKVMDAGWQVVPATSFSKQYVSIPTITVKEAGYIFAYLSYEDQSNNWVYFDDFKVTVTPTNIIQSNEYYSFGLQTPTSWTRDNATANNFLANGGTELNTTSNLYDLDYRNYDPILVRMHQVDPMASKYSSLTPYNYSFNSPVVHNDPNGADPRIPQNGYNFPAFTYDDGGTLYHGTPWRPSVTYDEYGNAYPQGSGADRMEGYSMTWGYASWTQQYQDQMRADAMSMTPGDYGARYGQRVGSVAEGQAILLSYYHPEINWWLVYSGSSKGTDKSMALFFDRGFEKAYAGDNAWYAAYFKADGAKKFQGSNHVDDYIKLANDVINDFGEQLFTGRPFSLSIDYGGKGDCNCTSVEEKGRTYGESGAHIRSNISSLYLNEKNKVQLIVGHELVHVRDYDSGYYSYLLNSGRFSTDNIYAMMETRAHSWSVNNAYRLGEINWRSSSQTILENLSWYLPDNYPR